MEFSSVLVEDGQEHYNALTEVNQNDLHQFRTGVTFLIHNPFNLVHSLYHFQSACKCMDSLRTELCPAHLCLPALPITGLVSDECLVGKIELNLDISHECPWCLRSLCLRYP
jgi:hypothetical protein